MTLTLTMFALRGMQPEGATRSHLAMAAVLACYNEPWARYKVSEQVADFVMLDDSVRISVTHPHDSLHFETL